MLLTDLHELKAVLEIGPQDPSEDKRLNFYANWATALIEQYLDRELMKKERTEYYGGSGTQKLVLRCRPAYVTPTPRVWVDEEGFFGSRSGGFASGDELTYGDDFTLWVDGDGVSKRAILLRASAYWPRPSVRQRGMLTPFVGEPAGNVKVTYTAGYTPDDVPGDIVAAAVLLVARLRAMFPMGAPLTSESYEDRSISMSDKDKNWLLGQVKHMLFQYRNRRF